MGRACRVRLGKLKSCPTLPLLPCAAAAAPPALTAPAKASPRADRGGMPACQRAAGHSHQDRAPLCMHGPEHACSGQPGVASLQGGRLLLLNLQRGEQALLFVSFQLAELLSARVAQHGCHRGWFCGRARPSGGLEAPFPRYACNLRSPQFAGYAANTSFPPIRPNVVLCPLVVDLLLR